MIEEEDADHVAGDSHWRICNKTDPDTLLQPYSPHGQKQNALPSPPQSPPQVKMLEAELKQRQILIDTLQRTARNLQAEVDSANAKLEQLENSKDGIKYLELLTNYQNLRNEAKAMEMFYLSQLADHGIAVNKNIKDFGYIIWARSQKKQ